MVLFCLSYEEKPLWVKPSINLYIALPTISAIFTVNYHLTLDFTNLMGMRKYFMFLCILIQEREELEEAGVKVPDGKIGKKKMEKLQQKAEKKKVC